MSNTGCYFRRLACVRWQNGTHFAVFIEIKALQSIFQFLFKSVLSRLKSIYFQIGSSHISSKLWKSTWRLPSRSRVRFQKMGDFQV